MIDDVGVLRAAAVGARELAERAHVAVVDGLVHDVVALIGPSNRRAERIGERHLQLEHLQLAPAIGEYSSLAVPAKVSAKARLPD